MTRRDMLTEATTDGPLWEADAWHAWRGASDAGDMLLVAGPTRRPPQDLHLGDGRALRYVRSFAHDPTEAERDRLLELWLPEDLVQS